MLMKNYKIIHINLVKKFKKDFIRDALKAHERFNFAYGNFLKSINSTNFFRYYNFIALTTGSEKYFELFKIIKKELRNFYKLKKPLWMQCWLNVHNKSEVLNWHNHEDCLFHGFISIDPKNTETEFKDFKIKNETGKMYIGLAYKDHRVKVIKSFSGKRITVAFDVIDSLAYTKMEKKYGSNDINTGFIPI